MTQPDDKRRDDIALAGEYALHLMDAQARRSFEQRLANEPDLRRLLREWDEGFAELADEVEPVQPPRALKGQVQDRLFGAAPDARKPRFSLFGLYGGRLAALAFAIVALAVLSISVLTPDQPRYVAEIAAEDQSLVLQASYDPDDEVLSVERVTGGALPGRVLELWLIADGADAPVSLGVLPEDTQTRVPVPRDLSAALRGGTLAISDEPPGGSPTGLPTGAVLAVGVITTL